MSLAFLKRENRPNDDYILSFSKKDIKKLSAFHHLVKFTFSFYFCGFQKNQLEIYLEELPHCKFEDTDH